jgi:2-oxo-4-hydroxy-4-carboxy-5-ureidoimidazoline decarboxylase
VSVISVLNSRDIAGVRAALTRCCAAEAWVEGMLARRPFADEEAVIDAAYEVGETLLDDDWMEAFAAHPMIGDVATLRAKFAATRELAAGEQSGVAGAHQATLQELAELNREYLKRFGFIFIVFASGKSAEQMLAMLRTRVGNCREEELQTAAEEQMKITELRLRNLAEEVSGQ